jgi:hypothetical protein
LGGRVKPTGMGEVVERWMVRMVGFMVVMEVIVAE